MQNEKPLKTFDEKVHDYHAFLYALYTGRIRDQSETSKADADKLREQAKKALLEDPLFHRILAVNMQMIKGLYLTEAMQRLKDASIAIDETIDFLQTRL